jgi:hypothetical protein
MKTLRVKVCREAVGMADVVALKAITMSSGLNVRSCNLEYTFGPERRWEPRSSDPFKDPFKQLLKLNVSSEEQDRHGNLTIAHAGRQVQIPASHSIPNLLNCFDIRQ